ncbi:hypothetical protein COU77_00060 [Candidatus Peregrinibacteria bacterium CG10_big_fil_rev_8_21_14_0_10_49_16]|nr:MAG: hypothetical protein COW95_04280 [Candidatus Peregrinibacteria bacterium CG22_combo_CG10-13_8_21_14_all_49_11]PIR52494.1 MAG: hypothetical protein COU77_00060 [Candidatus Peregrinibacteria bacterium CG10_big_fil_rev_8_21_14_0_10_49_16]
MCGDGVIKDNETCDDGNTKSSDGCASNCTVESGFTCSGTPSTCTSQGVGGSGGGGGGGGTSLPKKPAGPPPLCGNGLLNTDNCEECDYSAIDNPVEKGRCSQDCKWLYCGDGIISTDNTHGSIREECEAVRLEEERYTDSSSVVRSRYWFVTPSCGKSCTPPGNTHFLFGKWECRIQWLAPCTGDVTYERFEVRAPFTCGDNREEEQQTVVQRPPPPAHCGNRVVEKEKGEECDRGPANGTSDCSRWCEIFYCGDGIFSPQSPLREQCDAGVDAENDTRTCRASSEENHRCLTDCTLRFLPLCEPVEQAVTRLEQQEQIPLSQSPETTVCGNGILEAGEACDIGTQNSDTRPNACRTNCTVPRCGDGVIDTNELCDDGNTTSEDGCSALCLKEEEMLEAKEEVLGPEEVLGLAEEEETETETETETEVEVQVKTPGSQMQKEPTTPTLHGSPSSKAPSQAAFLGGILVIAGLVSIWRWWRMSHL